MEVEVVLVLVLVLALAFVFVFVFVFDFFCSFCPMFLMCFVMSVLYSFVLTSVFIVICVVGHHNGPPCMTAVAIRGYLDGGHSRTCVNVHSPGLPLLPLQSLLSSLPAAIAVSFCSQQAKEEVQVDKQCGTALQCEGRGQFRHGRLEGGWWPATPGSRGTWGYPSASGSTQDPTAAQPAGTHDVCYNVSHVSGAVIIQTGHEIANTGMSIAGEGWRRAVQAPYVLSFCLFWNAILSVHCHVSSVVTL